MTYVGLQVVEAHPLFPYFFTSKWFFCYNNNIIFSISVQEGFLRALETNTYIKFISMGSYFPEVRAFGILNKSTEITRLVICKKLDHSHSINDPLPSLYFVPTRFHHDPRANAYKVINP